MRQPIPDRGGILPASLKTDMEFIDLKAQYRAIGAGIRGRIERVLEHGQYIMGPEVHELEERLAEYVGVRHCVTTSSGTDSLLIGLMALGIGPGDEVITTPFSFFATAEVILLLGARPVFVDINPRTFNIDPGGIESAITPRTRAILPVSLYGQCAEFDAINTIAAKHALPVLEDGAQSFGASYRGRRSCGLSSLGATSFFPSKPLGGYGDGGALFTDDGSLAEAARQIRSHGQDRRYHHARIGINGRMDTLQAAVLLAKLDSFDGEVAMRQRIGSTYTGLLGAGAGPGHGVVLPHVEPWNTSVYAQYTICLPERDRLADYLRVRGIPSAVHYPMPLHRQPALNHPDGAFPVADTCSTQVLSLPMGPYLSEQDQALVVQTIEAYCLELAPPGDRTTATA